MGLQTLLKYFPDLSGRQQESFKQLAALYQEWNTKVNLISRNDIQHLWERHFLHSISIQKVINFKPGTQILDFGTGGGLPGLPLAIMFPESSFHLVDSIRKKINVVNEIVDSLHLHNVNTSTERVENIENTYDFIVGRAVTRLPVIVDWLREKIKKESKHDLTNGFLYLKGGEFSEELQHTQMQSRIFDLATYFEGDFFSTKKIVYLTP